MTTNLPFQEWASIIPDPRLCRALVKRLTYQVHIVDSGDHSIRIEEILKLAGKRGRKGDKTD